MATRNFHNCYGPLATLTKGKTMKTIFTLILLSFSLTSFGKVPPPGSEVKKALACKGSDDLGKAKISLIVSHAAVNPIASVRGISVMIKSDPKAKAVEMKLSQRSQDAYNAEFSGDLIKVMLDKSAMKATLFFASSVLDCK